jgi:hypothetical protein
MESLTNPHLTNNLSTCTLAVLMSYPLYRTRAGRESQEPGVHVRLVDALVLIQMCFE